MVHDDGNEHITIQATQCQQISALIIVNECNTTNYIKEFFEHAKHEYD